MSPSVDIIIVNWNSGDWLRKCLASVERHGGGRTARVIVVDNGSADGSADVDQPGIDLHIIRAGSNLGFGAACNLGAREATAPYLLFLNPDAALLPGSLEGAIDFMESPAAADVGVSGIRLIEEDGAIQRHCASFPSWRTFVGAAMNISKLQMNAFDHREDRDVDHVIGAFYLIRRALFDRIGGFDERFFVYLEDLDLSKRVYEAGSRIRYLAAPQAFHKGGGTSERVKATRLFYALRSRLLYARKHFHGPGFAAVLLTTLAIEPIARLVRAIARRSPAELADTCGGYARLFGDLPHILGRRGAPTRPDQRDSRLA